MFYQVEVVGSGRLEDASVRNVAHENRPTAQIHHHKQLEDVEGGEHRCIKRANPLKTGHIVLIN